jgi:hypothetical protein
MLIVLLKGRLHPICYSSSQKVGHILHANRPPKLGYILYAIRLSKRQAISDMLIVLLKGRLYANRPPKVGYMLIVFIKCMLSSS